MLKTVRKVLGCSLGISLLAVTGAGCADDEPILPRTFVRASLGPGSAGQAACSLTTQTWLEVGNADNSVTDRSTQGAGTVEVACKVVPTGDAFEVTAVATLRGASDQLDGSVSVQGTFRSRTKSEGVTAVFGKGSVGTPFRASNCSVEFQQDYQDVAAGRIWGQLYCDELQQEGGTTPRTCRGVAEFKFENCAQ